MSRLMLASVIALASADSSLHAQSTWPVRAGSEVRIETSTDRVFRGALLGGSPDTIRVQQSIRDSVIAVPRIIVRTYSVLRADRWHGAKRGFLLGGGVGFGLVAVLTAANTNGDASHVPIGLLALPVALLGGGIGAGVGASLATPEWSTPVRLYASRRDGLSLAVGYRF